MGRRGSRAAAVLAALVVALLPSAALAEQRGCLEDAAAWAGVHPTVLRAIAWVESRGNRAAINWNANGTYDVGLMQINSAWYHRGLAPVWPRVGDPCVNVAAAAWILALCTQEYGYTWDVVGCYHGGVGWTRSAARRAIGRRYLHRVQEVIRKAVPRAEGRNLRLTELGARATVQSGRAASR
jgi:soluble lytic murein transglycosylase-like protein